MQKQELVTQYSTAWANYYLVLSAITLFYLPECYSKLEEHHCSFGGVKLEFKPIKKLLDDVPKREVYCKELVKMGIRALIGESFEFTSDYCSRTKQLNLFRSQPWYHFARLIRNNISHGGHFRFRPFDKSILPVTFGKAVIDVNMDGQPLELENFGYVEAYELFHNMQAFAQNNLH